MRVKKLIFSVTPLACALLSGFSNAESDTKIYFGGDFGYNKYRYYDMTPETPEWGNVNISSSIKNKATSLGLMVGMRYCENFGVEAGYTIYNKKTLSWAIQGTQAVPPFVNRLNSTQQTTIKVRNPYLDFLGYVPFDKDVEFIGSIGIGQVRVKADSQVRDSGTVNGIAFDETTSDTDKIRKIGLRLGAGIQYNFNEHFSTRAMVRYQQVGKRHGVEIMKNIFSAHLGLIYSI